MQYLLSAGLFWGTPGSRLIASAMIGASVFMAARWLFKVLESEDLQQGDEWRYDVSRINELRRTDLMYRVFQPVIRGLGVFNRRAFRDSLPKIQREIHAAGLSRAWLAEEYLARQELFAFMMLPLYIYMFGRMFDVMTGPFMAVGATLATAWLLRRRLAGLARKRLLAIKRRMPYFLDLLTLLMEAGSTLLAGLSQAVQEFSGHPVSEEWGRVLTDMNLGKTRAEAFDAMRVRLDDDEITSIIGSILQGEQLGTPLARIFRTQANALRIKRTQRAETVAGEAGVNMLLPGVLVMVSTVLIIIGPFLMNYLSFGLSM